MQFTKASKKTRKIADEELTAAPETVAAAEVKPKTRTLRSSKTKKSDAVGSASPTHHHKVSGVVIAETSVSATRLLAVNREVTHEDIARLAYSFWIARANEPGSAEGDWLRAERELIGRS